MNYKEDVIVYDYETPMGCFIACFYKVSDEAFHEFVICNERNDLYKFVKFLELHSDKYFVGFNNLNFDAQITQFILDNYHDWFELSTLEITRKISMFGSDCIERQDYNLFLPYRENKISLKQIDLPRIWHFFNDKKRVSLKQVEYEMRAETIENFEISHLKEDFTDEEVSKLLYYCRNDVIYTYKHYLFTIGEVDHPLYKGKNKINDRLILIDQVGLDCLNWDDVKIGAEWNKKDYMEMSGRDEKSLKPLKVNHFFGKKYKKFFPDTVTFQTDRLKLFLAEFGDTVILPSKQLFVFDFDKDLGVTIARGGIHSKEMPRFLKPNEDEYFIQNDIGSQYPNAMKKYKIFPKHLGIDWNTMLKNKIQRRLDFKKKYKETKDPMYNSLQEMGKLSLNGGAYGRLGTKGDWQQDPCKALQTTIGCQLEILMIVEALWLKGFKITSCNTDGWDCFVPKNRLNEYFDIVEYYEEKIGNKEMGNVEFTVFAWMAQTNVNDYIAEKIGVFENRVFKEDSIVIKDSPFPSLKVKGDFEYYKELNKNTSFSIIPLALQNYYKNNIKPEDFINNHNDIFDYCARSNSGKTYIHLAGDEVLPKLIRYYVAKEGTHILKKVVDNTTDASDQNLKPADKKKKVCNTLRISDQEEHLKNLDKNWYIMKTKEIILRVEKGKKKIDNKSSDENQLSLF